MVLSDHKPLENIYEKEINKAPRRLQRILCGLQEYNIKLKWKPGS